MERNWGQNTQQKIMYHIAQNAISDYIVLKDGVLACRYSKRLKVKIRAHSTMGFDVNPFEPPPSPPKKNTDERELNTRFPMPELRWFYQ
jgi:hypothetical protein